MTPKEEAIQIYEKFSQYTPVEFEHEYAKKCAIIHVDGILDLTVLYDSQREVVPLSVRRNETKDYWLEVRNEIEKI